MKRIVFSILLLAAHWAGYSADYTLPVPAPKDSIGVEKGSERWLILHKVQAKETLFSIARKYGANVSEFKAANPGIESGVKIDQVVKVPVKPRLAAAKAPAKPTAVKPKPELKAIESPALGPKTHVVKAGESLFAVARLYKLKVEDLKNWNDLGEQGIKTGQTLLLEAPRSVKTQQARAEKAAEQAKASEKPIATESQADRKISDNSGFEKVSERGQASLIEESQSSNKFLGLHKTAPTGTILTVKNEQNGVSVFVRVIGKLNEAGENQELVLRVSRKAYERLGANGKRFPVSITWSAQ